MRRIPKSLTKTQLGMTSTITERDNLPLIVDLDLLITTFNVRKIGNLTDIPTLTRPSLMVSQVSRQYIKYQAQHDSFSDHIANGKEFGYPDAWRLVGEAADKMNITGKTVLVIGTEVPWLETILLQRKPRSTNIIISF